MMIFKARDEPGGFPRIGSSGESSVERGVCVNICEHTLTVGPIKGCVFRAGGRSSLHQGAPFRRTFVWACSI